MNYLKISIGIFVALAASRFVPHPPNFTSLLALSFYVPALLGIKFIPALIASFFITDFFIGLHNLTFFTWGTVIIIGLISKLFTLNYRYRILGALTGAFLFYLISNFGVWLFGSYDYSYEGLILCYTLAIPFFINTLISTLIFSLIIELIYSFYTKKIYHLKQ